MDREVIDRVKDRADIVEVIGSVVQLRKTGSEFKGLCPFHREKTPSFHVVPKKKMFKCFGCGAGGDVFKFFMDWKGMKFMDAVRHVANLSGQRID